MWCTALHTLCPLLSVHPLIPQFLLSPICQCFFPSGPRQTFQDLAIAHVFLPQATSLSLFCSFFCLLPWHFGMSTSPNVCDHSLQASKSQPSYVLVMCILEPAWTQRWCVSVYHGKGFHISKLTLPKFMFCPSWSSCLTGHSYTLSSFCQHLLARSCTSLRIQTLSCLSLSFSLDGLLFWCPGGELFPEPACVLPNRRFWIVFE